MAENTPQAMPSQPSFWNDPKKRAVLFQVLLVIGLITFFAFIFNNTLHNLATRGINTGFDFLWNVAGFGIPQSLIPYSESDTFGRTFVVGLLNTLLVALLSTILATIIGFLIGIARLSKNWLLSTAASVYIEIFRNIPLLLQIVFWYFAILPLLPSPRQAMSFADIVFLTNRGLFIPAPVPEQGFMLTVWALLIALVAVMLIRYFARWLQNQTGKQLPVLIISLVLLIGLPVATFFYTGKPLSWLLPELKGFNFDKGIGIIPELAALWIALSVYTAAFIAEIVRSGISAVSRGQTEAAASLGLRSGQSLRLITIPQAMRIIIPQMTSQYLNIVKNSSLATAIGYPDLVAVFAGTTLNQTGQAVEIIFITMLVYLVISLIISLFMNQYNQRMALVER